MMHRRFSLAAHYTADGKPTRRNSVAVLVRLWAAGRGRSERFRGNYKAMLRCTIAMNKGGESHILNIFSKPVLGHAGHALALKKDVPAESAAYYCVQTQRKLSWTVYFSTVLFRGLMVYDTVTIYKMLIAYTIFSSMDHFRAPVPNGSGSAQYVRWTLYTFVALAHEKTRIL